MITKHKGFFAFILIVSVVGGILFAPHTAPEAQAGIPQGVGSCIYSTLAGAISVITGILLLSLLGTVPTIDVSSLIKTYLEDPFERCLARRVLDDTIGHLLDVVRTKGRDGGTAYIRNWRNFQTSSQYRGEDLFRGILANTPICNYLRNDVYSAYGITSSNRISLQGINLRVGTLDPFTLRAKCPLPSNFDIAAYEADPANNGGWEAFNRMLQPQANPLGFTALADAELNAQRAATIAADAAETQDGYTAIHGSDVVGSGGTGAGIQCTVDDSGKGTCPVGGGTCTTLTCSFSGKACSKATDCDISNGEPCVGVCSGGTGITDPSCKQFGPNGKCISYSDIRSPGSYIRDVVQSQANQELAWVSGVHNWKELVISFLAQRLTNRLLDIGADETPPTYNQNQNAGGGAGGGGGGGGGVCPAPGNDRNGCPAGTILTDASCGGAGSFNSQVVAAINYACDDPSGPLYCVPGQPQGQGQRDIKPGQLQGYIDAVVSYLGSHGLSARWHSEYGDQKNVSIKESNGTLSQDYAVYAGGEPQARTLGQYALTCTPSGF